MCQGNSRLLALFCVLLTAAAVFAQNGDVTKNQARRGTPGVYEEMEIMRRVLGHGLDQLVRTSVPGTTRSSVSGGGVLSDAQFIGRLFTDVGSGDAAQSSKKWYQDYYSAIAADPHRSMQPPLMIEGTYVKGSGVLFNVSLPFYARESPRQLEKHARQALSPWEQAQKELLGERVDADAKSPQPRQDNFVDGILRLLADNGAHFSQLRENEQLTVALTFRGFDAAHDTTARCVACHATATTSFRGSIAGGTAPGSGSGSNTQSGAGSTEASPPKPKAVELVSPQVLSEVQNMCLLGDLHAKQGRAQEAKNVYEKAFETLRRRIKEQNAWMENLGSREADTSGSLQVAELYLKLARARQNLDDPRGAEQVVQEMADFVRNVEKTAKKQEAPRAALPNAIPVPSRLIFSASKALLDQAGDHKITFDEFKKLASVQYLSFGNADPTSGICPTLEIPIRSVAQEQQSSSGKQ